MSAPISTSKRRRLDAYNADGRNLSSPRSATTPLGPNRLTRPPDRQPPVLGQRSSNTTIANPKDSPPDRRPLSSRLRHWQYTYVPSHSQQGQPDASEHQQGTPYQQQMRTMMQPPPSVTRERANGGLQSGGFPSYARGQLPPGERPLPPSTPFGSTDVHLVGNQAMASGRFTPRTSTSQGANPLFIPQTPDPRRFVLAVPTASGPRIHSRAGNPDPVMHGRQRTPFFSGTRMG
ncbi:hypothetical protein H4582DRAFT_1903322 [Lactarius indigo]|nr:hypothetical protein H4582DRAFT_1903322 [Lactarius indigo]